MARTVMIEKMAPDVQRALEELFASDETVIISRDGQMLGCVEPFSAFLDTGFELTPEEKARLLDDIKQGEDDDAAGNYLTLDELKLKYAGRLRETSSK